MRFDLITRNQNIEKKQNCVIWIHVALQFTYIAKDVETRFNTSNYELDTPLHKGKK